ncbi:hypothetical protein ACOSP7_002833 [Xanthoceras sorbifolium]
MKYLPREIRASENNPCLIIHCDHPIRNQLYSVELSDNEEDQRVNKIRVPIFPEFKIIGSCKGLLCLCDYSTRDSLYAYNPFTRKYMELPKSIDETLYDLSVVFGFGFSQTTKEYKVVKVVYWRPPPRDRHPIFRRCCLQSEVQIFTLGKPAWRSLGKIPYHLLDQEPSQVLVNGRLHWSTWPRRYRIGLLKNGTVLLEYKCRSLVTYDQKDGTFNDLAFPGMPYWFETVVHEGSLNWIDTLFNDI